MGPVLLSTVANWAAWHHLYIVLFHAMHEERVQHRFPDAAGWLDKVPHVFINPSLVDWKGWQIHNGFSGSSIPRASACFLPIAEDITRASPVDNLINVGDVDTQTECYCCYNAAQLRTFGGKVTTYSFLTLWVRWCVVHFDQSTFHTARLPWSWSMGGLGEAFVEPCVEFSNVVDLSERTILSDIIKDIEANPRVPLLRSSQQ